MIRTRGNEKMIHSSISISSGPVRRGKPGAGAPGVDVRAVAVLLLALSSYTSQVRAAEWSVTELQYQAGSLSAPTFAGGERARTDILTFQHASGWEYGDNFIFIDFLDDSTKDGFNDADFYGEIYVNLSLGKIIGFGSVIGPARDIGLLAGVNAGADANVLKYLPGFRISWDIPGFIFFNLDAALYIDANKGASSGGAPAESDSYYVDINWAYPFHIGRHGFSIEGHVEYIAERTNEFGEKAHGWILAQPQLRYDLGEALGASGRLYVGVEWQYWMNKLGDDATDESAGQLLVMWRL